MVHIELERYLEDIEARLDEEQERRIQADWRAWIHHENKTGPYVVARRRPIPPKMEWPHVNINDAIADDTLAIYRELESVNNTLARGEASILRVRPNYGVGNVASSFGAETFVMPRETDTLPNVLALSEDKVMSLMDKPIPDATAGNLASIMRFARNYKRIQEQYPKIAKYIRVEQPDFQGPMDNLELIMGSSAVFYGLYDDPDSIHVLLDKITGAMERFFDSWLAMFPENRAYANYFMHVEEGTVCIRDDSAMNLSPEMVSEFIVPYDGRLLKKYGGFIHFCGRGDHFIDRLAKMEGLTGFNMSQPHLNDMETIYKCTIDRGIHLGITAQIEAPRGHDNTNLIIFS